MNGIFGKIEKTIRRFGMVKPGEKILIALSGGPDSVCLFQALVYLAGSLRIRLAAAHVNYGLRPQADEEERFCRELCRFNRVRFHCRRVDVLSGLRKGLRRNLEEFCRIVRYDYFDRLSDRYVYARIATGHTADDSAETFLLNLIRGADVGGLGGINPAAGKIIRPLIAIDRNEVMEFVRGYGLSYRIDSSNLENVFARNKIRNKVMPVLREINSSAVQHIASAGARIRHCHDLIDELAREAMAKCSLSKGGEIWLDMAKLGRYHAKLADWVLVRAYRRLSGDNYRPRRSSIDSALSLKKSGSCVWLGPRVLAVRFRGRLALFLPASLLKKRRITCGKTTVISKDGMAIRADLRRMKSFAGISRNRNENRAFLDAEKAADLRVRNLKAGDRFKPLNMGGSKKVVDFLNEKGVPGRAKQRVPIVTAGGKIAWIVGYGISDEFKVGRNTRKVLELNLVREKR